MYVLHNIGTYKDFSSWTLLSTVQSTVAHFGL